jgi:transcriptional regulator with XRE-family HTH domain
MAKSKKSKFDMAVINKVREMRNKRRMTQGHIAGFLELSRGYIGQVESPRFDSKYNLNHLNRLAIEMECSPRDFIPEHPINEITRIRKKPN